MHRAPAPPQQQRTEVIVQEPALVSGPAVTAEGKQVSSSFLDAP